MSSNLDRNPLINAPKWSPEEKLLADFPQYEGGSIGTHPVHLAGHVKDIDPERHAAARGAFELAVSTTNQIYRSTAVLADSRATLEPYAVGNRINNAPPVPGATARWNDQVTAYQKNAARAHDAAMRAADAAEESLGKTSESLEGQIKSTLKILLSESVQTEIRSLLRSKNTGANAHGANDQLMQLVSNGDLAALSAVLSAPAFLSGLEPDQVNALAEMAAHKHAKDLVVQRDSVTGLRQALARNRAIVSHLYDDGMSFAKPIESKRPQVYSETPRPKARTN